MRKHRKTKTTAKTTRAKRSQKTIKWHEEEIRILRGEVTRQFEELQSLRNKMHEVLAMKEALEADKKWLQQMHSAVLQSMIEFHSRRH